ncbi:related to transcriptional regulator rds2 [Ceraceosorus bombacis]|uniref:Related to transcriptional regulator rds2 n=1 Tax=Ceraceosorus bombacis TaxID=401625 RepID=A0A0P1BNW2_9BASI|nr:related to transcriptional regulator rds2 [Ceraceosorus bombacis]
MVAGAATPTAAATPGSVTNSPAPSVRSIASHEGSASGKTSASAGSGGSGQSPNSSASWGSHHAASTLHALASGQTHMQQSPPSAQRPQTAQSNRSDQLGAVQRPTSLKTPQIVSNTKSQPAAGNVRGAQPSAKGVPIGQRHAQPIAARPPAAAATNNAGDQRPASSGGTSAARPSSEAIAASPTSAPSVTPALRPSASNSSAPSGAALEDSKALFTSSAASARPLSSAAQPKSSISQSSQLKVGPSGNTNPSKPVKLNVPFKHPVPNPPVTANKGNAQAKPCQRCVKKGIADTCTDGARKKAKYLLDDDELLELKREKEAKKRAKQIEIGQGRASASSDPAEFSQADESTAGVAETKLEETAQTSQDQQLPQWPEEASMMNVLQPALFDGAGAPSGSLGTSSAPPDFFGTVSAFSPAMQAASFGIDRGGIQATDSNMNIPLELEEADRQGQPSALGSSEPGARADSAVYHGPSEFGSEATSLEYSFLSSMLHGIDPHLLGGATPDTDPGSHGSGGAATGGAHPGTPTASAGGGMSMVTASTWPSEGLLSQPFQHQQIAESWQPARGFGALGGRVANLPHLHMGSQGAGGWRWEGKDGSEPAQTQERTMGAQPAWDAEVDYERAGAREQAHVTQNAASVGYSEERSGTVRTMHVMPPTGASAGGQGESYGALEVPSPNDTRTVDAAHGAIASAGPETQSTLQAGQMQPQEVLQDLHPTRSATGPDLEWRQRVKHVYSDKCKPFAYTEGYHFLLKHITARYEKSEVLRIVRALAIFRPSLIALQMPLTEDDEIFVERSIQRTILELEKLISFSGTPTVVWRRTCEICVVGMEFCMLTQRTRDSLLGRYVYEFFDTDSSLRYWESFALHAFENTASAVSMTVKLLASDGRVIPCAACFSIKRDQFDLPSLVVGNFLPLL